MGPQLFVSLFVAALSAVDSLETCSGVSLAQMEKDALIKRDLSVRQLDDDDDDDDDPRLSSSTSTTTIQKCFSYDGEACQHTSDCCGGNDCYPDGDRLKNFPKWGKGREGNVQEMDVSGTVCENPDNVLVKCFHTAISVSEYTCTELAGSNLCPTIGGAVSEDEWFGMTGNRVPSHTQIFNKASGGYLNCGIFRLKCTWTVQGIEDYMKVDSCDFACHPACVPSGSEYDANHAFDPLAMDGTRNLEWVWSANSPNWCPRHGGDVTYRQAGMKSTWTLAHEYGLITCVTPEESYAATAKQPVRSKVIQCGNQPAMCRTRHEAMLACEEWSRDPTKPTVRGKGELCYKYELGETVGRSCKLMWTNDAAGAQGCYESNHPGTANAKRTDPLDYNYGSGEPSEGRGRAESDPFYEAQNWDRCEGKLGDLICKGEGPLMPPWRRGFDAACCVGHLVNPYDWRDTPLGPMPTGPKEIGGPGQPIPGSPPSPKR